MKKVIILLIFCSLLLSACGQKVADEKFCLSAADCFADACCHASDAVNKDFAPGCEDVFCSASCEPNTLDCGQGHIECIQNQCTVVIDAIVEQGPQ